MSDHYMFIDGGHLDQCFDESRRTWCDGAMVKLDYARLSFNQRKVFYYDALPIQRRDETDVDFQARYDQKLEFFDELRALDGWHVHLGISKRYVGGRAQQKEVDVLLAVDMLSHTYRKNANEITFLAGDQDFRPLLDAVVRDGMYVRLMYDPKHTSVDLINMADGRAPIDYFGYAMLLDHTSAQIHRAPVRSNSQEVVAPPNGILKELALKDGELIGRLWTDAATGGDMFSASIKSSLNYFTSYHLDGNRELLKRVINEYYGPVMWTDQV